MNRKCLLLLLIPVLALGQMKEPILKLDTGGHMGSVNDVVVAPISKRVITCSDDKTIRIWDPESGQEIRKILGQIGPGAEGMIFAIAISPDEKILAAGGFMEAGKGPDFNYIRIYDFATGNLLQLLKGHNDIVTDLAFSKDGKYLASASTDNMVKLWDAARNFRLAHTYRNHGKQAYGVAFTDTPDPIRLVTAGFDNKIMLHTLEGEKTRETFSAESKMQYVATGGDWIAACGFEDAGISLFYQGLRTHRALNTKGIPVGLAFSPGGKKMISGSYQAPYKINVYDAAKSFKKISDFGLHDNTVRAVAFLDNETAVSAGGNNHDIYIWDADTGKEKMHMAGDGELVWASGIAGKSIAYGNTKTSVNGPNEITHLFSLEDFMFMPVGNMDNPAAIKRMPVENNDYKLRHEKGGDFGFNDGVLVITGMNGSRAKIIRDASSGYRHNVYGLTDNGIVISGGNQGQLQAYDIRGKKICDLIGHTGSILSLATENNRIVSGGEDQTIRLWNIDEIVAGETRIEPVLSCFISKDNEWVVWSKSGYYNASVGGDKYIGYHINQGRSKEAQFYRSDRFFTVYFRPEIISAIVKLGSEEKALAYAGKRRVDDVDVANILPPVVQLNSPAQFNVKTGADEITVDFTVIPQSEHPVTEINILVNGRPMAERGMRQSRKRTGIHVVKSVPLPEAQNTITLTARNHYAAGNPVSIQVEREKAPEALYKPTLYILSVGVSRYQNETYNLDYAAIDAQSIVDVFKPQEGKIYGRIHTRLLMDEQATKDEILGGIDWLDRETTQRDVVVIFIAGHGINDDYENFYFLSHEADEEQLRRTAVKWVEFEDIIRNLPSKVILMADACHSGNIMGGKRRSLGDFNAAVKSIISAGTGQVIMTATTGNAVSIEDPEWGHGAFTLALVEGLMEGKADYDKDKTVTIKEIDLYVTMRVKELTNGRQKPTTIIPGSIPDFAVTVQE